jgi:hypothetical protein
MKDATKWGGEGTANLVQIILRKLLINSVLTIILMRHLINDFAKYRIRMQCGWNQPYFLAAD